MSNSNSNSNSNTDSNARNSANNSSEVSRSRSPYGHAILHQHDAAVIRGRTRAQEWDSRPDSATSNIVPSLSAQVEQETPHESSRPSTPTLVYIVTSNFTSQTTADGIRLSESDIVGFQILAVFARLEDANSYAEHECEEIDVGVRHRRSRRGQGGAVGGQGGAGIRADAIVRDDGTVSWTVESVGHIDVGQWVVQ